MLTRLLVLAVVAVIPGVSPHAQQRAAAAPAMHVYKTPTCGCCSKWVDHMRQAGFTVTVDDLSNDDLQKLKAKLGVPPAVHSCHTGRVAGYLVEGHIPADTVKRLLKERPKIAGIAVPGMPIGSPGMEVPGARPQPYDVVTFDTAGTTKVFATIKP